MIVSVDDVAVVGQQLAQETMRADERQWLARVGRVIERGRRRRMRRLAVPGKTMVRREQRMSTRCAQHRAAPGRASARWPRARPRPAEIAGIERERDRQLLHRECDFDAPGCRVPLRGRPAAPPAPAPTPRSVFALRTADGADALRHISTDSQVELLSQL